MPTEKKIELTEVEATLRRLLLDVAEYIDNSAAPAEDSVVRIPDQLAKEKLVLRFTGGWVRDKLLGQDSNDIDVAINKMTGEKFGLRLKEYLEIPGNPEKYGLEGVSKSEKAGTSSKNKLVGGLHKIEANPEKSKHLETTTTKILGLDIDLVNLRKETYTDDSRNPEIEFGTPEEDALRRDATVNAMFYNINTSEIEDFTNRGWEDMQQGIIRTPLEPYQTFKDDPLRVLRLIRFATRLGYRIDPEAEKLMGNEDIKKALHIKISRERVGVELEKMLRGRDPLGAIQYIDRLGLYETVFADPTKNHDYRPPSNWAVAYQCLARIMQSEAPHDLVWTMTIHDAEEAYTSWIISAIVPYADAPEPKPVKAGTKVSPPVAAQVVREAIKATNKIFDVIIASVKNLEHITSLKDKFAVQQRQPHKKQEGEDATARDTIGMAIRQWGQTWRSQALFALLYEVLNAPDSEQEIIASYGNWFSHIKSQEITEAYALKPLIDGKTLAKALETNPGPWMKDALDVVMAWQLRNPDVQDPSEAIEEVRIHRKNNPKSDVAAKVSKKKGELTSHLASHFLQLTIRPLFAKARNSEITAQGRRVIQASQPRTYQSLSVVEMESNPWKNEKDKHVLSLLRWVVATMAPGRIEQSWPLLVPPILTLLDDAEPRFKTIGCELLYGLLDSTTPSLLARTGLEPVFRNALESALSYLPPLTPEPESTPLLNAAYPAFIALIKVTTPLPTTSPSASPSSDSNSTPSPLTPAYVARANALATLLSSHILPDLAHQTTISPHVGTARTLLSHLCTLLPLLGVHAVQHLKGLVPLLAAILADPLAPAAPRLLADAARAAQQVILTSWPRVWRWRGEMLKGVAVAWVRLAGETETQSDEVGKAREELRACVELLSKVVAGGGDGEKRAWEEEVALLVKKEEKLRSLFEGVRV
ncbi:tRNA nucleotidyltransferase [Phyllosticta citrichinensis]|uniref:tRNA nucleotidyltransferase n=1 Tax=Phyllosticta citrichinensis TaxID=1130410 RepID=A0ABR1XPM5_9PEZI